MANSYECLASQRANGNTGNGYQADEVSDDSKGYIRELDQSLEKNLYFACVLRHCVRLSLKEID